MTDSEDESSRSQSLGHDMMSVSDPEDGSREDDMPSAELTSGSPTHDGDRQDHSLHSDSSLSSAGDAAESQTPRGQGEPHVPISAASSEDRRAVELMSGSYSEILSPPHFNMVAVPEEEAAPALAAEGTLLKDGDFVHFIATNLESKIRLSSQDSEATQSQEPRGETLEPHSAANSELNPLDSTLLSLLEREARCIAASVDCLTDHLANSLHTISAVTAQSLTVYKDSVCKTCDAMDANIKSMYQLMAKCEELSKSMAPIYKQAEQVKEIKKLLDIMENLS